MQMIHFEACGGSVVGYLHEDSAHLIAHKVRPAMIVVPGGGYNHVSAREADDPAMEFFTMGYNAFILTYTVGEGAKDFAPLRQLANAVATVRKNSAEWHIDPEKIAVIGFSAGGHLAASVGARWPEIPDLPEDCCPNALVLSYPVITTGEFTHPGTRNFVSGFREEQWEMFSVEKRVTAEYPATFLWHSVTDQTVPVENTLLMAAALQKNKVPFECHIFAEAHHGSSVCTQEVESRYPACRPWVELCKTWLNTRFDFVP